MLTQLFTQDWLYDEGDDATKAVYIAKMDELKGMAGPIIQRHFEKVEAERQAVQERIAAEKAAKAAADEEARKSADANKGAQEATNGAKDEEMTDAEPVKTEAEEVSDESGGDEQLAAGVSLPIRHDASTTMTTE